MWLDPGHISSGTFTRLVSYHMEQDKQWKLAGGQEDSKEKQEMERKSW